MGFSSGCADGVYRGDLVALDRGAPGQPAELHGVVMTLRGIRYLVPSDADCDDWYGDAADMWRKRRDDAGLRCGAWEWLEYCVDRNTTCGIAYGLMGPATESELR